MKKLPLFIRLFLSMFIIVLGMIVANIVINYTFLEDYYISQKEKELQNGYRKLSAAYEEYDLTSDRYLKVFRNICASGNFSILVLNEDSTEWVSSSSLEDFSYQINTLKYNSLDKNNLEILLSKKNYAIVKQVDSRSQVEYLILSGIFEDGAYIYMRTPLEGIRDSVEITTRFLQMIEIGTLIVAVIVILFVARSITRPVHKLTKISKQMKELDFEVKYEKDLFSPREVDELGNNMNEMSLALEHSILELKAANLSLRKDIEKKEQIDNMRKEFLSNVSHELKTPLALIQGYSEGLKEGVVDEGDRDYYCDVIIDETQKMNAMVRKLLSLNQLEFGNELLEIVRFDLSEMIRGKIRSLEYLMKDKDLQIEFEEASCYVVADEYMIEEVLTNYLTNAMNHVDEQRRIKISYLFENGIVRICVYNSGKTIPEDELQRIWEKFYKVDKARTREYGGNGIGLSIVQAIMERHGQKYGVNNRGEGVEFWFELECAKKA